MLYQCNPACLTVVTSKVKYMIVFIGHEFVMCHIFFGKIDLVLEMKISKYSVCFAEGITYIYFGYWDL